MPNKTYYHHSQKPLSKRDLSFKSVRDRAENIALSTGQPDPNGLSHAFLWAKIQIGKFVREELITASENFSNWNDVETSVKNKCPEVIQTWLNWD